MEISLPKIDENCKIDVIGKMKTREVIVMAFGSVSLEKRIKRGINRLFERSNQKS